MAICCMLFKSLRYKKIICVICDLDNLGIDTEISLIARILPDIWKVTQKQNSA